MRLREYEYILAIAREKTIARAAQTLFISQPALSRLLASVEDELGTLLFERRGREMIPTETGRYYIENAKRLVELNDNFKQGMKEMASAKPAITVATPLVRMATLIHSALPILREQIPNVSLHTQATPQSGILDRLLSREYQLAFGIVTEEYASTLSYRLVGEEETVLAVPKGHALEALAEEPREGSEYPFIDARHLAEMPFILSQPESWSARFAARYFHANNIAPSVVVRVPTTSMLLQSVASGSGLAFVPSIPLDHMHMQDTVTYLAVQREGNGHAVGLLFRRDRELQPEEELLADALRRAYRESSLSQANPSLR